MQEVTDVESRTDLPENHATQPAKAQSETQLEKAQQSVLIHLQQEMAPLQEADMLKAKALQQEEASQQAEDLTARTASNHRTGTKKPPKPLLPLKQQKMEYV